MQIVIHVSLINIAEGEHALSLPENANSMYLFFRTDTIVSIISWSRVQKEKHPSGDLVCGSPM